MNYNFTPAQVRWEITRLATKYPDFNYKRDSGVEGLNCGVPCLYVFDGRASCIVGQALNNLGVPLEVLSKYENWTSTKIIQEILQLSDKDLDFHMNTLVWIDRVQVRQDSGNTWSDAINYADERALAKVSYTL
ncbi:hypothetical protein SEA_WEASELS2_22 [Rhodococcus phage Weasels2]|uniref:Uncharacterized protein n=1 Tax=Rhodococcus phage Weasels2 TaxID=1897437 RepID=A0A1I9SA06_9CAUD|nr:hypothetical protein FDH04_gp022 [Rhodococcus phage Weasels2]AOZ63612.1 hypothetical protein SEA_WEASELS2_22 [Rhodococcus phage Weasels2]